MPLVEDMTDEDYKQLDEEEQKKMDARRYTLNKSVAK